MLKLLKFAALAIPLMLVTLAAQAQPYGRPGFHRPPPHRDYHRPVFHRPHRPYRR